MEIKIYSLEKGVHNPYSQKEEPLKFNIAQVIINSLTIIEMLFGPSSTQVLGGSTDGVVPLYRAAMLVGLDKFFAPRYMNQSEITAIFGMRRFSLISYKRAIHRQDSSFELEKAYKQVEPILEAYVQIYKVDQENSVRSYRRDFKRFHLEALASYLGHNPSEVGDFLKKLNSI